MDLACEEEGARVVSCTSYDTKYVPSNVIGSDANAMWISTGAFPQEIIIQFTALSCMNTMKTTTKYVRRMLVEYCASSTPSKWEKLYEGELPENEGEVQLHTKTLQRQEARFIKFKILSGWNHFVVVQKITVEGSRRN